MYCKYCGKQVDDDSTYCFSCGKNLSKEIEVETHILDNPEILNEKKESSDNIDISDDKNHKEDEERNNDKKNKDEEIISGIFKKINTKIADEIITNLKMIGIAFALFIVFIAGFYIVHWKDHRPLNDKSSWGESCYDTPMEKQPSFLRWDQHYAIKVLNTGDYKKPIRIGDDTFIVPDNISNEEYFSIFTSIIRSDSEEEMLSFAARKAKEKSIPQSVLDQYKKESEEYALNDEENFKEYISNLREYRFKEDLYPKAVYAAIICFVVTVFGRYIIKLIIWVYSNKST